MSKKITITLEFDHEDTTREEVKKHLKDLIQLLAFLKTHRIQIICHSKKHY